MHAIVTANIFPTLYIAHQISSFMFTNFMHQHEILYSCSTLFQHFWCVYSLCNACCLSSSWCVRYFHRLLRFPCPQRLGCQCCHCCVADSTFLAIRAGWRLSFLKFSPNLQCLCHTWHLRRMHQIILLHFSRFPRSTRHLHFVRNSFHLRCLNYLREKQYLRNSRVPNSLRYSSCTYGT